MNQIDRIIVARHEPRKVRRSETRMELPRRKVGIWAPSYGDAELTPVPRIGVVFFVANSICGMKLGAGGSIFETFSHPLPSGLSRRTPDSQASSARSNRYCRRSRPSGNRVGLCATRKAEKLVSLHLIRRTTKTVKWTCPTASSYNTD